ncbi:hypothetical protein BMT54_01705 [Pasteurellaceae bacterium 15-036681]|nr:hypothetical protein BMT54_01705 [Pasteurellaceae bacterium 15-036681]
MSQKFKPITFASHENGLKFTVEDPMDAKMLSSNEKKDIIYYDRNETSAPQGKGKKAKATQNDDLEQEIN